MDEAAVAKIGRHPFTQALEQGLRACGVLEGARILLAVSGGADSVALLTAMAVVGPHRPWALDLHVAHVQHHLRANAEQEARFVRELAEAWKLPFHRRDIHPSGKGQNLEASARKLRYGALAAVAGEIDADLVATAHHQRDQVETILMRLIRGASVAGLGAMALRRRLGTVHLIRPMLHVDPAAGRDLLERIGQGWCEDETNLQVVRQRARVRHTVLPALYALSPAAGQKACDSAARLREASRLIARVARAAEKRYVRRNGPHEAMIDRGVARRISRELLAVVLRRQAIAIGAPGDHLGWRLIEQMVDAARDGKGELRTFTLAQGVRVEVSAEHVRWVGPR